MHRTSRPHPAPLPDPTTNRQLQQALAATGLAPAVRASTPQHQLAVLHDKDRTAELIGLLLPYAIAAWAAPQPTGGVHHMAAAGVAAAGITGIEALTPWIAAASGADLIDASGALHQVLINSAYPGPPRGPLAAEHHPAWRSALRKLRRHAPSSLKYTLTLQVSEITGTCEGEFEEDTATVTCYQSMAMGMTVLTPYTVELTRDGAVKRTKRPPRWPVHPAAMPGLRQLLATVESNVWSRPRDIPWVMVFESQHQDTEREDWRDGYEHFTATRHGLRPGVVREVRPFGPDEVGQRKPQPVLPKRSALRGQIPGRVPIVMAVCDAIEGLLKFEAYPVER